MIAEFRGHHPGDVALIETAAWASFVVAREIGRRQLPVGGPLPA